MSQRHESIKWDIIAHWTATGRGRLYCMNQGLAIPWESYNRGLFRPIWFGPLRRTFKGFPDTFGFELINGVPVFCTVEIKTKNDKVKPRQKIVMNQLTRFGVRCYVGWEDENMQRGFRLEWWKVAA